MEEEKKEKLVYWCCVLGGPHECVLDCSKCLHNKTQDTMDKQGKGIEKDTVKYLDIEVK